MAGKNVTKRIREALDALAGSKEPLRQLVAARALREAAEQLEIAHVQAARDAGATWQEIGGCYGLTKQGAQQRFGAIDALRKRSKAATKRARPRSR